MQKKAVEINPYDQDAYLSLLMVYLLQNDFKNYNKIKEEYKLILNPEHLFNDLDAYRYNPEYFIHLSYAIAVDSIGNRTKAIFHAENFVRNCKDKDYNDRVKHYIDYKKNNAD